MEPALTAIAVSEKQFQQAVVDLARLSGWRCYHTHDARRSTAGFPDLVMVKNDVMLVAELKAEGGRLSAPQRQWLAALGQVTTVHAAVWRPADWDVIERRLLQVVAKE